MGELVPLPESLPPFLAGYLPNRTPERPFVTLTYAQSLDSRISAKPGVRTVISHLETKTMTHYLRSFHDAILIGVGTAEADDPKLSCRYSDHKIRPVIVDPLFRWNVTAKSAVIELAKSGEGLAPWVVLRKEKDRNYAQKRKIIEECGGQLIEIEHEHDFQWNHIFGTLKTHYNIQSVMVEGGATVINSLLMENQLVDSLIITIGPVFLGNQGAMVSPPEPLQLSNVNWWKGVTDSVMCAQFRG